MSRPVSRFLFGFSAQAPSHPGSRAQGHALPFGSRVALLAVITVGAFGVSPGMTGLTSVAAAQAGKTGAEDTFSLDEPDESAPAQPPAPTPEETAAAAEEPAMLGDEQALQEEAAPDETFRESTDPYEDPKKHYLFVGGAWRYVRMPSFVLEWFLDAAPSIGTAGSFFGEVGYRKDGFQVTGQLGWMNWNFTGPFQLAGDKIDDTEWLDTKFNFLMATATVTWSTAFTDWFALEYGVEGGFATVFGDMKRNEAYKDGGNWRKCPTWAPQMGYSNAAWPADMPPTADQQLYCDPPLSDGGGQPPATNESDEIGAHYNVKAKHGIANKGIPHAVPVIGPRLSLRFKPIHQLVIRVDVPLPLAPFGFVGGVAAHFGF